jgi:hypothetical protein
MYRPELSRQNVGLSIYTFKKMKGRREIWVFSRNGYQREERGMRVYMVYEFYIHI